MCVVIPKLQCRQLLTALQMPDEEAFSLLVRLMHTYDLRGHFLPEMPKLQLRLVSGTVVVSFAAVLTFHSIRYDWSVSFSKHLLNAM
jgi:hypothetical protein